MVLLAMVPLFGIAGCSGDESGSLKGRYEVISLGGVGMPDNYMAVLRGPDGAKGDCSDGVPSGTNVGTGTPIIVHDGEGSTLATSELGPGVLTFESISEKTRLDGNGWICTFSFTIDLPSAKFYRFQVGDEPEKEISAESIKGGSIVITAGPYDQ